MKFKMLALCILFSTLSAQAGTLIVTCGKNAYESLEAKDLTMAEFVLKLSTKGPNNPAQVVQISDDGNSLMGRYSSVTYKLPSITVNMKNSDRYEIRNLTGCSSIETATGDITYMQNKGGFAGVIPAANAKCSCIDREL